MDTFFNGKIQIKSSKDESRSFCDVNYNYYPKTKQQNKKQLFYKIHDLKLDHNQSFLSERNLRKEIAQILDLDVNKLLDDSNKFSSILGQIKEKNLFICAHAYGSYICLSSLFSHTIPQDKYIEFSLGTEAIALFPKKIYRHNKTVQYFKKNFTISFKPDLLTTAISSVSSLSQIPKILDPLLGKTHLSSANNKIAA